MFHHMLQDKRDTDNQGPVPDTNSNFDFSMQFENELGNNVEQQIGKNCSSLEDQLLSLSSIHGSVSCISVRSSKKEEKKMEQIRSQS